MRFVRAALPRASVTSETHSHGNGRAEVRARSEVGPSNRPESSVTANVVDEPMMETTTPAMGFTGFVVDGAADTGVRLHRGRQRSRKPGQAARGPEPTRPRYRPAARGRRGLPTPARMCLSCRAPSIRAWPFGVQPYEPLTVKFTSRVSVLLASLSVTLISSR